MISAQVSRFQLYEAHMKHAIFKMIFRTIGLICMHLNINTEFPYNMKNIQLKNYILYEGQIQMNRKPRLR